MKRQLHKIRAHFVAIHYQRRGVRSRPLSERIHIDFPLLTGLFLLTTMSLIILYSASSQNAVLLDRQIVRFGIGFCLLFLLAQIPPAFYRTWTPWLFGLGLVLLIAVLSTGHVAKGAQRWLNLGFVRFQPAEMMKLAVPMMLAWYFSEKVLPPRANTILIAAAILFIPVLLIAKEPDLGTALLILGTGGGVFILAGISWRLIASLAITAIASAPLLWFVMHDYQRKRVMTFLYPERDPLGSGYHIIQSKIAIGSGGLFGKGWLNGTQSHLQFLPEHATDFIFAVMGEEFGFIGSLILIAIYAYIIGRCLYIASEAQDSFTRLLAGSLSIGFFISLFINMGMVTGLLPVVGLPLPMVSYGGSSMVTILASFGILMSIHTHRKLVTT